jgi:V/A-type H+/Na+-transporting ATPase subunit D
VIAGVPGGRAGRAWLVERLSTAERGAELLDGKLRVLQREQRRYSEHVERTARAWARSCAEAETWLVRAALLGGQRALRHAVPVEPAVVDVRWADVMGVRHPGGVTVTAGRTAPGAATPSSSALVQALSAYRDALGAAAEHAVVHTAARRIDAEVANTRRRLHAIRDRHLPRLREALSAVELELEELEHAEGVRLRWAIAHAPRTGHEQT